MTQSSNEDILADLKGLYEKLSSINWGTNAHFNELAQKLSGTVKHVLDTGSIGLQVLSKIPIKEWHTKLSGEFKDTDPGALQTVKKIVDVLLDFSKSEAKSGLGGLRNLF